MNNPILISWNVTKKCNLKCRHCYRDAGTRAKDELSTAEGFKLLREIAASGFKIVILSGGEPLLRKDIYELISYGNSLGLRMVLGTNGTLVTGKTAEKLKKAGTARIGISLDSANEKAHDEFRGIKGSFKKALKGMENCRKTGLPFQLHTTVYKRNKDEINKLTKLAESLGAVAHHIFFLINVGRALDLKEEQLEFSEYEKLLKNIVENCKNTKIELKPTCAPQFMRLIKEENIPTRLTRGCLAGTSYCVILPDGVVHPCPYLPLEAGDVRDDSFEDIWQEAEVFKTLRNYKFAGKCGECDYKNICGGCRARAFYSKTDYMEEDPWCFFKNEIKNE